MHTKKYAKKMTIFAIILIIFILIINQVWIDAEIHGLNASKYRLRLKLNGKLVVTSSYNNFETNDREEIYGSKFLSISQLSEIISLATVKIEREEINYFGGIKVDLRIGFRRYDIPLFIAQNESLNELLMILIEYSPIKIM